MQINPSLSEAKNTYFYTLSTLLIVCVFLAIATETILLVTIPLVALAGIITIVNYRILYYFLIAGIPVSYKIYILPKLTTDLPVEPLMVLFLGIAIIELLINWPIHKKIINHPLVILILAGIIWSCICTLYSVDYVVSIKYLLAKLWYVGTFVIMAVIIGDSNKVWKKIFWLFYFSLLVAVTVTLIKHSFSLFSFDTVTKVISPFFSNHVTYSTVVALFLPYVWIARGWFKKGTLTRSLLNFSIFLFLFAIITSYTRATWLSIPCMIGYVIILKKNYFSTFWLVVAISTTLLVGLLLYNNNYMRFSPDYEKTVFNKGNIDKHLEATYKLEDVSGMERVYRWVAAKNMIADNPILGTGPNTFHPEYKKYTESEFRTYVSDNPEQSTTHNYFLMIFSEQGFPGFLLFVMLVYYTLKLSNRLYHKITDTESKNLVLAATLSIVVILFHLLLNDLIETEKIGTMFYLAIAILISMDLRYKSLENKAG
ncbi:MAG TPA: O-antigen ligase family protein [Cytophagaceae bacterium]